MSIFKFLDPNDLLFNVQSCCKRWRQIILNPNFWGIYGIKNLDINLKYRLIKVLSNRRTKGNLAVAENRFTLELFKIRLIDFSRVNGNINDGIPGRVMREISFLRKVDNLVVNKIEDYRIFDKSVMICYKYYPRTLNNFIYEKDVQSKNLDVIKSIVYQLLFAIQELNKLNVIHRNLRPQNINLDEENNMVKLCDFFCCREKINNKNLYTPEPPKGRVGSTREAARLFYKSPEMILSNRLLGTNTNLKSYESEIDIWKIGCIFAEIVLGNPLFDKTSEIAILFEIFSLLGTPNWPELSNYPKWGIIDMNDITTDQAEISGAYNNFHFKMKNRTQSLNKLATLYQKIGSDGINLLSQL